MIPMETLAAFSPQMADPARGSLTLQMLLLGGVFIVSTILVLGSIALVARTVVIGLVFKLATVK